MGRYSGRVPSAHYDDTDPDAPVAVYLYLGTRFMLSEAEAHDLRRDLEDAIDCIPRTTKGDGVGP